MTSGEELYDCTNVARAGAAQQTWCEARAQYDQSTASSRGDKFADFLRGYRDGVNHARLAKDSRLARTEADGRKGSAEEMGYRAGYNTVLKALGMIEYDCNSSDRSSEYKERWCEASDSFRASGIGGNNPFVKGRFIDGYMAGGRVALTVPTSMESFFNGENPEGKQPAIVQPEGDSSETVVAFYRGFDEGYKAMITSIRESINQVMEQMQMPENMNLPEGMMPPQ
ncbi:hypothetical protein ACH42_10155 [Endozoicomonas sp. (ex Bugula neritina AB1)]|nr:hypothetical protein ACH42_10155 [Endozoicomonas sp. (ex Bugula neritina AB1)]